MVEWVNNNGKRALLIGVGGIGSNVYLTELQKYGYDVTTVDNTNPADHTSIDTVQGVFDVAVICVPNFLHTYFADLLCWCWGDIKSKGHVVMVVVVLEGC